MTDSGTTTETPTSDWASQDIALGMRDIIAAIADSRVELLRPTPSYAIVQTINRELRSATVLHVGDSEAVTVAMASIEPANIGQTVRIGGLIGHRYIEDVLGDAVLSGAYPAEMGSRFDATTQARFGNVNEASKRVGYFATADGNNLVIGAYGQVFSLWDRTADGTSYRNHASFRANDHYISPWWMGASPYHSGQPQLHVWGRSGSSDYTLLSHFGSTLVNAWSGQSVNLRVSNAEKVVVTADYCTIYPTISCNAISCASINTNGYGLTTAGITCGNISSSGTIWMAAISNSGHSWLQGISCADINCGNINAGSGTITCGAINSSSRHYVQTVGGVWDGWGLLNQGGVPTTGFHNGTYASGMRTHAGAGETIELVNWNQSGFIPLYASNFPQTSTIATKRDVRPLRPERERIVVRLDPAADKIDQPDVMALRPVAFRRKILPHRLDPDTNEATPEPEDTILGAEARREHLGLIAEEVQYVIPSAVTHDADGAAKGIDYSQITVALLDHVQRLTDEIATLRYRLAEVEKGIPS